MDKIARIRQEIKRLRQEIKEEKEHITLNQKVGYLFALTDMESFLDILSEEPDKSLEEAAEEKYPVYWKSYPKDGIVRSESSYDTNKQCREAFIAGAEWQARQLLQGSPMPEDTVLFQKGIAEGRRLEREDSVECMSNILVPDDLATNEEIKKMLQERRAMIEKEVQRRVFNEVEHCWEEAHHEGYVEGWNECEAAYKSK